MTDRHVMDPATLAACAAALGRGRRDVLAQREDADLIPALLAELVLASATLRPARHKD